MLSRDSLGVHARTPDPATLIAARACSGPCCAKALRLGRGEVHCPGPRHPNGDRKPSLSVSRGASQPSVFHCKSGCTQEEVIAELEALGIWHRPEPNGHTAPARRTTYTLTEDGRPVAEHVRTDLPDGDKRLFWQLPGADKPGLNGRRTETLPLYRSEDLADLPDGATVVLCEGEKATDAARALRANAVGTVTGAAGTPSDDVLAVLKGRDVVLWPDNDDEGRRHMARVGARLAALGTTPRVIDWTDAPPKGDAADFCGTAEDLAALIEAAGGLSALTALSAPRPFSDPEPPWWEARPLISDEERVQAAQDTFIDRYMAYARMRTDAPAGFQESLGAIILGAVIGRRAVLRLSQGDVYPTLWVMLIADSTIYRKSTAMDLARELVEQVGRDYLAPNDFTPQRFVAILAENDGRPLTFIRDEFSGFFEGLNRLEYMGGLKELLCNVYDARPFRREKMKPKAKEGQVLKADEWKYDVREPFLGQAVGTTMQRFMEIARINDLHSGFLPRYAFVVPDGPPGEPKDLGELTRDIEDARDRLAKELVDLTYADIRLTCEPAVFARFNRYTRELEDEARGAPDTNLVAIVGSRISWMALRVAMLLAVVDGSHRIALPHLLRGIAMAERWRHTALDILSSLAPSKFEQSASRVVALVNAKGAGGIGRQAVMRALKLSRREMDDLEATLGERGEVRVVRLESTGGRPPTHYYPATSKKGLGAESAKSAESPPDPPTSVNGRGEAGIAHAPKVAKDRHTNGAASLGNVGDLRDPARWRCYACSAYEREQTPEGDWRCAGCGSRGAPSPEAWP
jgi:hypothetical protein